MACSRSGRVPSCGGEVCVGIIPSPLTPPLDISFAALLCNFYFEYNYTEKKKDNLFIFIAVEVNYLLLQ